MDDISVGLEKRRHQRVESRLPVEYRNLKKSGIVARGSITRNLSEGGVCFQSSEFMSLACRLVVEITIPNLPKPVKAISKIAWVRRIPSSDLYELGNQFLEIAKEDKAHVSDFVNKILNPDF